MPDIHLFVSEGKRHDLFAKFDYMGVLPTKLALDSFMRLCDLARSYNIKLPPKFLAVERRAYDAIHDRQYVTTKYPWKNAITNCWYTPLNNENKK